MSICERGEDLLEPYGSGDERHANADNKCCDNDDGLTKGKRVRVASLLGDLDLEVEFCSPQKKCAGRLNEAADTARCLSTKARESATEPLLPSSLACSTPPATGDVSNHGFVGGDKDKKIAAGGLNLPRPAPAKIANGTCAVVERRRQIGEKFATRKAITIVA